MSLYIIEIASAVFVISCLACTLLLCANKWGLITLYDLHIKGKVIFKTRIGELCIFCVGFWFGFILVTAAYFVFHLDDLYFVVPFASASLTRLFYENSGATTR